MNPRNRTEGRYAAVPAEKSTGVAYTPRILADFVAERIVQAAGAFPAGRPLRVFDPAIGNGELLVSLLNRLAGTLRMDIEVCGFETDRKALDIAQTRIKRQFPAIVLNFQSRSFLELVFEQAGNGGDGNLFQSAIPAAYDLIIANPPYVRTQIMGASQAQHLAKRFGLSGRVDLYYAFLLGMAQVLDSQGVAGIIVSNRFMTTRSGASVRRALLQRFNLRHIWDLGDTKLFEAAVLPAVLLAAGKNQNELNPPSLTSIYQTTESAQRSAADPIDALSKEGSVEIGDGRRFHVRHGKLDTNGVPDGIWRIATETVDTWLSTVKARTWGTFRDIGKIRVGVKTCADKVFIRSDWQDMPEPERPELLRPVITHRAARRFRALATDRPWQILYPHEVVRGFRQAVDLSAHPRSKAYLDRHRPSLESRAYIAQAGRKWYEIWVPQDPDAWCRIKLVFRDIAEKPCFWIDRDGTVVNGDCYWLIPKGPAQTDLLWLAAAIGNSTFIEKFYDCRFHNKLYAGRRRFMTQYVEEFPLPCPHTLLSRSIIAHAKKIYDCTPSPEADHLQEELDAMIWKALQGCRGGHCQHDTLATFGPRQALFALAQSAA